MEYGLTKVCSGNSRDAARCSPEEKRVASGEAVAGKGFRRTGDDEGDEADDRVLDRIDSGGIRGLAAGGGP